MDSLPKRKQNRLTGYDYSQPGCYFVTICAKNRRYLFWDEFDWRVGAACGRPRLSPIGTIVEKEIHRLSQIYSMVCVDKFVVMPNHIHLFDKNPLFRKRAATGRPYALANYQPIQRLRYETSWVYLVAKGLPRPYHPQRGRLSPHLGLYRHQPRQMAGGLLLLPSRGGDLTVKHAC